MGSGKNYLEDGGFTNYEWREEETLIGGYKVLYNPTEVRNNLPLYSDTSNAYFKRNESGEIDQMRIYVDRKASMDIDLMPSEPHTNKNPKEIFPIGIVHVHDWAKNKNGEWRRSKKARLLTEAEIAKWGDVIRLANPNVKFKPE